MIDGAKLAERRAANEALLAISAPVLDQTYRSVGRSGCGVVLSDVDGVILESRIGAGDSADFAHAGLIAGAQWDEAAEGTNGIGTCLAENRPVVIHRDQHFATRNIGISCMDAPVHDPHGQLIAALDVSSCREDHSPAMAEMIATIVRDAAIRIERDLFCSHFATERIVLLAGATQGGSSLLAVDQDNIVIGANRMARAQLGISDLVSSPQSLDQLLGRGGTQSFDDGERAILRQALARCGGNASAAARLLGIGRATLYRRMARAGLQH